VYREVGVPVVGVGSTVVRERQADESLSPSARPRERTRRRTGVASHVRRPKLGGRTAGTLGAQRCTCPRSREAAEAIRARRAGTRDVDGALRECTGAEPLNEQTKPVPHSTIVWHEAPETPVPAGATRWRSTEPIAKHCPTRIRLMKTGRSGRDLPSRLAVLDCAAREPIRHADAASKSLRRAARGTTDEPTDRRWVRPRRRAPPVPAARAATCSSSCRFAVRQTSHALSC